MAALSGLHFYHRTAFHASSSRAFYSLIIRSRRQCADLQIAQLAMSMSTRATAHVNDCNPHLLTISTILLGVSYV